MDILETGHFAKCWRVDEVEPAESAARFDVLCLQVRTDLDQFFAGAYVAGEKINLKSVSGLDVAYLGTTRAGKVDPTPPQPTTPALALLLDKLGELIAFERTGTRAYTALISKYLAVINAGEDVESR